MSKVKPSHILRLCETLGIRQITGAYTDNEGGFCAAGIFERLFRDTEVAKLYRKWDSLHFDRIIDLNDQRKLTFSQIADIMEKEGY